MKGQWLPVHVGALVNCLFIFDALSECASVRKREVKCKVEVWYDVSVSVGSVAGCTRDERGTINCMLK